MSEPTPEIPEVSPEEAPKQEVKREVVELVRLVCLFLVIFWGLKTFVIEGYEVQGDSMLPNLHDGERILVFKLPHKLSMLPFTGGFSPIDQGDIVVFDETEEGARRYVKRVVARGEKRHGNQVSAHEGDDASHASWPTVQFDKGTVYVNDWPIEEPYLAPEERTSPDVKEPVALGPGEYYVLGDHRSVSKDSRRFGAVDRDQIIGRAVLRFWPLGKFGFI